MNTIPQGAGDVTGVREIISTIRGRPEECQIVRQMPAGTPVFPGEVWIAPLGLWVRTDGFSICGDRGRGYTYPGWFNQLRLRSAISSALAATAARQASSC